MHTNDLDDGIEITLTRYDDDDDDKLCVEVDISEGRAILQRSGQAESNTAG